MRSIGKGREIACNLEQDLDGDIEDGGLGLVGSSKFDTNGLLRGL